MSHPVGVPYAEARECPEMCSTVTAPGLEVFHVTTDPEAAGNTRGTDHFFTPDGHRYIFRRHRPAAPGQPAHAGRIEYTLCETADEFRLRALTTEPGVAGACLGPDGAFFYYLDDHTKEDPPYFVLKRVALADFRVQELAHFDTAILGVGRVARGGLAGGCSLRADGKMIATGGNFRGADEADHFAPIFINLDTLKAHGFAWEPYCWRVGGTYYRGSDPAHRDHLLMVRCNCSQHWDQQGKYSEKWYSEVHRAALHVVTEQGEIVGTVPIGGEGEGVDHPTWRGGRYEVVTHTSDFRTARHWRGAMLCAAPAPCAPAHYLAGNAIPGGHRWDLTRQLLRPDVCHHAWHVDGLHAVCDTEGWHHRGTNQANGLSAYLWLATVVEPPGADPYVVPKYLLHPNSSWNWAFTENCPVLSPDLRTVFFNSDWLGAYGVPQVFAVRGFTFG